MPGVEVPLSLFVNSISVMGWQNRLKFIGKTNQLKISLIFTISCNSLISLWSFCTNLLENYPSRKIDQLSLLRILSLCMDHSMQTRINSLYLFLLFLFMPLALIGHNDVSLDSYNCFSLYNSLLCLESSIGAQVFPMLGSIPQYMDHLLISLLSMCRYFPQTPMHELCRNLVFWVVHFQIEWHRWRSLEPCFALCVKIVFHIQYATMWLPLH